MIRVRICTSRCRCQSSCRRSRFSGLGIKIRGKRSSSINCCRSWASLLSVFCFLGRLVLISAGSPIHSSKSNSASKSLEPARIPGSLHPYTHADSFLLQLPIESLGVTIFMVQSPFSALTGFFNKKSNLLKTRVVIYAYNHHVRLLSPESLVVRQPSLLGSRSRHCYAIMWICCKSSCPV